MFHVVNSSVSERVNPSSSKVTGSAARSVKWPATERRLKVTELPDPATYLTPPSPAVARELPNWTNDTELFAACCVAAPSKCQPPNSHASTESELFWRVRTLRSEERRVGNECRGRGA